MARHAGTHHHRDPPGRRGGRRPAGEHDLSTADELRRVLVGLAGRGSRIVIDFTDATFIDSTTLNTILASRKQADSVGIRVALVAPVGGAPRRVVDLIHAGDSVRVFPTQELAIVALTELPIRSTQHRGRAAAR